jgi:hypothetical protein
MKTLMTGALVVYLLVPIGASAQVPQADAPPRVASPVAVDRRVVDTRLSPRRFKVEAVRIRALDESGYDFIGADEVIAIIRIPAHNVLIASKVFDNVDTGETKRFPRNQNCILPIAGLTANNPNIFRGDKGETWTCSAGGTPGPFAFTVEMYEKDDGAFHDCVFKWPLGCEFSDGPTSGSDDLVGRRTLVFSLQDLEAVMPNVGDWFEETIRLGGPCGNYQGICGFGLFSPTGPEYEFTWLLTRLPDGPILDPSPSDLPQVTAR